MSFNRGYADGWAGKMMEAGADEEYIRGFRLARSRKGF